MFLDVPEERHELKCIFHIKLFSWLCVAGVSARPQYYSSLHAP